MPQNVTSNQGLHCFSRFLDGFFKNPSFKIAMSRRAGVRHHLRFTFWLTFFQSYMLSLFNDGLHSYLVGMKRRTGRFFTCKRNNSYFLRYLKKPVHYAVRHFLVLYRTTGSKMNIYILGEVWQGDMVSEYLRLILLS